MKTHPLATVVAGLLGSFVVMGASAAPVTHYSERYVNSAEYVNTADYANTDFGRVRDYSGAAVEWANSGTRNWAYSNGSGYAIREEESAVYAKADLSAGELKARSYLRLGAHDSSTSIPAYGTRAAVAAASASFADSLSFSSGGTSYLWNSGDVFNFALSVHGDVALPAGHAAPVDFLDPYTAATLRLEIYRPGGLQALADVQGFDFFGYRDAHGEDAALAELARLNGAFDALFVDSTAWCLGPSLTTADFCGGSFFEQAVLDADGKANLGYTFAPGGDFEFVLNLETWIQIDLSYENVYGDLDFSHTIAAGFDAPEGVTVHSASGLFPDTQPLQPSAVPEPGTLLLLSTTLLGLGACRVRSRRSERLA